YDSWPVDRGWWFYPCLTSTTYPVNLTLLSLNPCCPHFEIKCERVNPKSYPGNAIYRLSDMGGFHDTQALSDGIQEDALSKARNIITSEISAGESFNDSRQDPPFSQLPLAPPNNRVANGIYQRGSDQSTLSSMYSAKGSSSTLSIFSKPRSHHRGSSVNEARSERWQSTNNNLTTNEVVKPRYYGAYLARRGLLGCTRQLSSSSSDAARAPHPPITPLNPISPGQLQIDRPFPRRHSSIRRQSAHSLTYSFTASTYSPSNLSFPIAVSRPVSSMVFKETSDESENETCSYEDALSSISHCYDITPEGDELREGIADKPTLSSPSTPFSTPRMNDASPQAASTQKAPPRGIAIDQSPHNHCHTSSRGPEQSPSGTSNSFPAESDEHKHPTPQLRLVKGRKARSSPGFEIPGRYTSIYEDASCEWTEEKSGNTATIGEGMDDDNIHGAPVTTPSSCLIDVLNRWEKIPTNAEVPLHFIDELRHALNGFEECRLAGSDDLPSESLGVVISSSHTSSSDSHDALGSQQSSSSGKYATSSDSNLSHEASKSSRHWTPFSERSRIPASRQLGTNHKLQIEHHRAWLSATPTFEITETFSTLRPLNYRPSSPTTLGFANNELRYLETKTSHDTIHKRNLHTFFGSKGGTEKKAPFKSSEPQDLLPSKPRRRSQRKISITAELTKTVKGGLKSLKIPALQEKTDATAPDLSGGFLSEGENLHPQITRRFSHRASRRTSSCSDFNGRPQLSSQSSNEYSHFSTNSKKTQRVRFQ
ncbi:hypothetical protein MJO29_009191, partial [Puccinia striiformis f. sp. tritici]